MIETRRDAKQWGMFVHLAAFSGWVGLPLGWFLGPLVLWLLKRDEHAFVDDQGREALDFQLNMLVYGVLAFLLCFVVIGIPLLIVIGLANVVVPIVATVEASKGKYYRYPCVSFRVFSRGKA